MIAYKGYWGIFGVIRELWDTLGGYSGLVGFSGFLGVFWLQQSRGLVRVIWG